MCVGGARNAQLKKKRDSPSGATVASSSSSATVGCEIMQFCCRWMPFFTCSVMAATTRGWLWPVLATPMPVWKSRYCLPPTSVSHAPAARAHTKLLPFGERCTAGE